MGDTCGFTALHDSIRDFSLMNLTASTTATPPRISIVMPCLNRANMIEQSLRSIVDQNYPNLELIVIDGGSTDGSLEIIQQYANHLAYWCSEPDQGPSDALNKGFSHATGNIMAWLNTDDLYFPWTFRLIAEVFTGFPDMEWISSLYPVTWNSQGIPMNVQIRRGFSRQFFYKGYYMQNPNRYSRGYIQLESTFWRRSLWEKAGSRMDLQYTHASDFELWSRFFQHAELHGIKAILGGFRLHGNQLSVLGKHEYQKEAYAILREHGGKPCGRFGSFIRHHRWPEQSPLTVLPSLGFIQPSRNIRWSNETRSWIRSTDFITS